MSAPSGLREQKKQATRHRISDIATRLFAERGFDAVTVEDVARAAEVSKMTVFNYFPRKEDLVVDRDAELLALVHDAMAAADPLAGLRAMFQALARQGHPLMGAVAGAPAFWALITSSPVLVARTWALSSALEHEIAHQLGRGGDAPDAMLIAAMIAASWRAIWRDAIRRVEAGDELPAIRQAQLRQLDRAFDAVERGFSGRRGARPAPDERAGRRVPRVRRVGGE
ncbi:MAG TPA: TetR family transcriptional regulator [Kofleriaceae bacterium]|nr:TetR family transcriptional regulator [Kofleriaceae bacterium]